MGGHATSEVSFASSSQPNAQLLAFPKACDNRFPRFRSTKKDPTEPPQTFEVLPDLKFYMQQGAEHQT
jgi:hypothetical protein